MVFTQCTAARQISARYKTWLAEVRYIKRAGLFPIKSALLPVSVPGNYRYKATPLVLVFFPYLILGEEIFFTR